MAIHRAPIRRTDLRQHDGQSTWTYPAWDALTVAAGVVHAAGHVATGHVAEIATSIVERDKPIFSLVKGCLDD